MVRPIGPLDDSDGPAGVAERFFTFPLSPANRGTGGQRRGEVAFCGLRLENADSPVDRLPCLGVLTTKAEDARHPGQARGGEMDVLSRLAHGKSLPIAAL